MTSYIIIHENEWWTNCTPPQPHVRIKHLVPVPPIIEVFENAHWTLCHPTPLHHHHRTGPFLWCSAECSGYSGFSRPACATNHFVECIATLRRKTLFRIDPGPNADVSHSPVTVPAVAQRWVGHTIRVIWRRDQLYSTVVIQIALKPVVLMLLMVSGLKPNP